MRERLRMMRLMMRLMMMRLLLVVVMIPVPLDRNGDETIRRGQMQTEQRRVIELGREKDVRGRRIARAHDSGGGR